jgi:hypothetical protein
MTAKGMIICAIPFILVLAWVGLITYDIRTQPDCGWRKPVTSDEEATRLARRSLLTDGDFQRLTNFKSKEDYERAVTEAFWGANKKIEIGFTGAFVWWSFGADVSNENGKFVIYDGIDRCGETVDRAFGKL